MLRSLADLGVTPIAMRILWDPADDESEVQALVFEILSTTGMFNRV